jgi:hypothetical protein
MSGEIITFDRLLNLVVVQCCSCGVEYAIPSVMHSQLKQEKEKLSTMCPNGHGWHFVGKTEKALREEAEQRAQIAERRLREATHPPKVYETSAPRDKCTVCGRSFIRLRTHQTRTGHGKRLKAV